MEKTLKERYDSLCKELEQLKRKVKKKDEELEEWKRAASVGAE
jgi:chaperonin cofactor prefoldin